MNLTLSRTKKTTPAVVEPSAPVPRGDAMRWTGGGHLVARTVSYSVYAALICGPLALLLAVLNAGSGSTAAPVVRSDTALIDSSSAVGAFATNLVSTWLRAGNAVGLGEAGSESLSVVYAGGAAQGRPGPGWVVRDAAVAGITQAAPGVWSVTVSASVAELNDAVTIPADEAAGDAVAAPSPSATPSTTTGPRQWTRRFYAVAVRYDAKAPGAIVSLTLPAPVPAPSLAAAPSLAYPDQIATDSGPGTAAEGFLRALLTGDGDITRWVSPRTAISPITPAPYAEVHVLEVDAQSEPAAIVPADGTKTRLLLTVELTGLAGQRTSAQYALTLTSRARRWETSSLDPAPAQPAGQPRSSGIQPPPAPR